MPNQVTATATTKCTFGLAPSTLMVTPEKKVIANNLPAANILDNKPFVNIIPFGLCTSLANPITAAQTAAALGVLTPGACTPVIPAPWAPGHPTALVGSAPALTMPSICMCAYGGAISIINPGGTTTMVG